MIYFVLATWSLSGLGVWWLFFRPRLEPEPDPRWYLLNTDRERMATGTGHITQGVRFQIVRGGVPLEAVSPEANGKCLQVRITQHANLRPGDVLNLTVEPEL